MFRSQAIALLVGVLALTASPARVSAGLFSITAEADALIHRQETNRNFGGDPTLSAIYSTNTNEDRKTYLRFNLASITEPTITAAELLLETPGAASGASITFNVFGLNDDVLEQAWVEGDGTLPGGDFGLGGITWGTAPANIVIDGGGNVAGNGVDPSETTSLGTFSFSGTQSQTVTFSNQALIDFLQTDTDGLVTLIITRETFSTNTTGTFASKENGSFDPPTLDVTAIPEPGSIGLFAMGMIGLIGYRWRRRQMVSTDGS